MFLQLFNSFFHKLKNKYLINYDNNIQKHNSKKTQLDIGI